MNPVEFLMHNNSTTHNTIDNTSQLQAIATVPSVQLAVSTHTHPNPRKIVVR